MNGSITSRVGRIISGSLNALVDAVENAVPETVLQEAIREIDAAIDDVRTELGKVIASKHLASTRLMGENQKHEGLVEKIELAVKEGRDDLAEAAIAKQLDIEAQIPVLENTIADCGAQEKELEGYIAALQAKKREMQEDLKHYQEAQRASNTTAQAGNRSEGQNNKLEQRVEKAGAAFDRVMENLTGLKNTSTADKKTASQLAELETMARKNRIQERLADIKRSTEGK